MKRLCIFAIAVVAISCNTSTPKEEPAAAFDINAVKKHIDEANKGYGERFTSNDTAFYNKKYCRDAIIMPEQPAGYFRQGQYTPV